uniref:Uncharacterized protein n=1 Tax=Panagrolaimus sp. JU765 TaxID=591449 RepID=A0AC34RQI8_9BILA
MKTIAISLVVILAVAFAEECKDCANNALRADNIEQALLNLRRSNLPGAADLTTGNAACVTIIIAIALILAVVFAEECKNCANNALRADNIEQALLNLRQSNLPGAADLTTGSAACVSCCCSSAQGKTEYCCCAVFQKATKEEPTAKGLFLEQIKTET